MYLLTRTIFVVSNDSIKVLRPTYQITLSENYKLIFNIGFKWKNELNLTKLTLSVTHCLVVEIQK